MTLDTRVYVHDQADYREVFAECNQLIGADEGTRFTDRDTDIANDPGQGLCAWLWVHHGRDGTAYRPVAEGCEGYCDRDCEYQHDPACWVVVSFDTSYGYDVNGEGCGDLHARLVAELGRWLDSKGLRWSWRNEFTGDLFQGHDGLASLR